MSKIFKSVKNFKFPTMKGGAVLSNMNVVLHNVFVLYFILVLSLANMFYLVSSSNYMFAAIFILVGFLTSFFSKNMMVILCIALVVSNVLMYGKKAALEGFEEEEHDLSNVATDTSADTSADTFADVTIPNTKKSTGQSSGQSADETSADYEKLLGLQNQITDGMSNLNGSLTQAESLLKKLANTVNVDINV